VSAVNNRLGLEDAWHTWQCRPRQRDTHQFACQQHSLDARSDVRLASEVTDHVAAHALSAPPTALSRRCCKAWSNCTQMTCYPHRGYAPLLTRSVGCFGMTGWGQVSLNLVIHKKSTRRSGKPWSATAVF